MYQFNLLWYHQIETISGLLIHHTSETSRSNAIYDSHTAFSFKDCLSCLLADIPNIPFACFFCTKIKATNFLYFCFCKLLLFKTSHEFHRFFLCEIVVEFLLLIYYIAFVDSNNVLLTLFVF